MKEPEWILFERRMLEIFPDAKATSGSGMTWSDGDGMAVDLCFEAKCQKTVKFDSWWKQTRLQAETYNKVPCLVIWRPPVELKFGPALDDECLAVVPAWYLAKLRKEIESLKEDVSGLESEIAGESW